MEINNPEATKLAQKGNPHPAECRVIYIAVVSNKTEDGHPCVTREFLAQTNELHIVISDYVLRDIFGFCPMAFEPLLELSYVARRADLNVQVDVLRQAGNGE